MPTITANNVELHYESFGKPKDPAMILINGLGAQQTMWDAKGFCGHMADRGFRVVRFDNRDSGLSQKFDQFGNPDIMSFVALLGQGKPVPPPPYRMEDLAADTFGLMDALGIERAHIVGMSMGGVVAQLMVIGQPQRVLSLTLLATTSGDPTVPGPEPKVIEVLVEAPKDAWDKQEIIEKTIKFVKTVQGSKHHIRDEALARARVAQDFDRCHNPTANHRLTHSIMFEAPRTERLRNLRVPTLVLHGDEDAMVPPAAARHLAETIPGARLHLIDGLGHVLPESSWPILVDSIAEFARQIHT